MSHQDIKTGLDDIRSRLAALREDSDEAKRTTDAVGASLRSIHESLLARQRRLDAAPRTEGREAE